MRTTILIIITLGLLAGSAIAEIQVGDQRDFWGWDLSDMPPADREFTATCRAVGQYGYVWVEDAVWETDLNAADVATIIEAWDDKTPADQEAGIFPLVTDIFGDPPDAFDDDPKIYLLYYDIGEYGSYSFDGFFRSVDQTEEAGSNQLEMLHLNSSSSREPAGDYMLAVAAHELVHMIIYNYDKNEASWIQESLAEAAMIVCGYFTDLAQIDGFAADPQIGLIPSGDDRVDYGAALLFGDYLYERFGEGLLGEMVAEPQAGISGLEAALTEVGEELSFADLFGQWTAANYADLTPGEDDFTWGYGLLDPPAFDSLILVVGEDNAFDVSAWGTQYFHFALAASGYDVQIESDDSEDLRVHLIEMDQDLEEGVTVTEFGPVEDGETVSFDFGGEGFGVIAVANASGAMSIEGLILVVEQEGANDDDDDDLPGGDDDDDDDGGCGC